MSSTLKEKINIIVGVYGCILVAWYGLMYNSFPNLWFMYFTIPFILCKSIILEEIRFDINLLFLMETFFVKAMLDQHTGKSYLVPTTIAIPMLAYLFGKLLVAENPNVKKKNQMSRANISIIAMAIGTFILGFINYKHTNTSPIKNLGYYSVAFTHNEFYTDSFAYYFNFIFLFSIIVGTIVCVLGKIANEKTKKFIPVVLVLMYMIAMVIGITKYIKTERYLALKEGVRLIITKHWGNFGLDLTYNSSTSNMWLDYGRDYGILVFGTLFIFFILTIKDVIKLSINKNVKIFTKTSLILIFTGVNTYYFIDSFSYQYPTYWYIGLIVSGIISEIACHAKNSHE